MREELSLRIEDLGDLVRVPPHTEGHDVQLVQEADLLKELRGVGSLSGVVPLQKEDHFKK